MNNIEVKGYKLIKVKGGEFMMGSADTERGRYEDEGPLHLVRVPDFYMGKYPVTNEQYGIFLQKNPEVSEPQYWGNREYNKPNQPVVGVSWDDATKYAQWSDLQLPTEAVWEYACRAGSATAYCGGDTEKDLDRVGWYNGNSHDKLHSVGEKEPNQFGLYDMHGNVWEWVQDWYDENYYSKSPIDNPRGLNRGSDRVIRGGSWYFTARYARAALRFGNTPDFSSYTVGLRLFKNIIGRN